MTFPTHLLMGLIIGKITGNFSAAIIGSLAIDIDHLISFYKHGILFKPKKLLKEALDETDPWGDQRNFLHNIFVSLFICSLIIAFNPEIGITFSLAYIVHIFFDAMNKAPFYPFFPSKKFAIKGFIKYNSKKEIAFMAILIIILSTLFIIKI
jgi:membrane-bound metal-dependent hydrolase YbcI (DUF457 family)